MKKIISILALVLLAGSALSAQLNTRGLLKVSNPSNEQAREFFNWTISATPIRSESTGDIIPGFSEFRSSKGTLLHVGNDTYTLSRVRIKISVNRCDRACYLFPKC